MTQTDEDTREHLARRGLFRSIRTRLAVCFSLVFVTALVIVELLGLGGVPFAAYAGRIATQKADALQVSDAGVSDADTHGGRSPTFHIGHVIRLEADRAVAVLLPEVSVEDSVKPMRADMTYTALTGLLGIIAVVLLTRFLVRRLTDPIVSLGRTAARVAEGDLEARTSVTGSDEVGMLAVTFDYLIGRIQGWRRELEEADTALRARCSARFSVAGSASSSQVGWREMAFRPGRRRWGR